MIAGRRDPQMPRGQCLGRVLDVVPLPSPDVSDKSSHVLGHRDEKRLGRVLDRVLDNVLRLSHISTVTMSLTPEWCTKKQAAKVISRTERTVSRIVRDAVEKKTMDILANLKLVYANGDEFVGPEVTIELLVKNEQEGSRTRWFFRRAWWSDDFAQRINERSDGNEGVGDVPSRPKGTGGRGVGQVELGAPPTLPVDPSLRAVVLEHLHYSDRKHASEIRQLTERVLQVVETNQQLQGQTNTLYNQFQDTLKQSGGLRALIEGTPAGGAKSQNASSNIDVQSARVSVVEPLAQERGGDPPKPAAAKRNRPKTKAKSSPVPAKQDPFPNLRRIARFLGRK